MVALRTSELTVKTKKHLLIFEFWFILTIFPVYFRYIKRELDYPKNK